MGQGVQSLIDVKKTGRGNGQGYVRQCFKTDTKEDSKRVSKKRGRDCNELQSVTSTEVVKRKTEKVLGGRKNENLYKEIQCKRHVYSIIAIVFVFRLK